MGAPNVNDNSIESSTKATRPLLGLLQQSKEDLAQGTRATHHTNNGKQQTFVTVLEQVHKKANVFDFKAGRKYTCFPEVENDLYNGVNVKQLHRWIRQHQKSVIDKIMRILSFNPLSWLFVSTIAVMIMP